MPDYWVDPYQHDDYECAFCGNPYDLVDMHVRNENRGGRTTVTGCRSCNSSMHDDTLTDWLRRLKYSENHSLQEKWNEILNYHWHGRTGLSAKIHRINGFLTGFICK